MQPILTLGGRRFSVRTDRVGRDLALAPLEGAGSVRLELRGADGAAREDVVELSALLVGRDGSAVLARAPGAPTEVPVGDYRLGIVTARLADPRGGPAWSFVFSEAGPRADARWRSVDVGAELAFDPLGELDFRLRGQGILAPGGGLTVVCSLVTADGLRINTAYRGREAQSYGAGGLEAIVELVDGSGAVHASARSGFA